MSETGEEEHKETMKNIEALNLILPAEMSAVEVRELETPLAGSQTSSKANNINKQALRGYQTLQELRKKTAEFRQGYLNWRQFKPRGARGEATDVLTGRTDNRRKDSLVERLKTREGMSFDQAEATPEACVLRVATILVEEDSQTKTVDHEEAWLRFYFNPFTPAEEKIAQPLSSSALPVLSSAPGKNLEVPKYDRNPETITDWIMHLGVGQFHRSHQLVYLDDLLHVNLMCESQCASKWGYCGVGLMSFDLKMAEALRSQDLLFTVLSRSNASSSARVIGSMFDYVFAPDEAERAFQKLLDPKLKIVSLTVTEKGYCQNSNAQLDLENPWVKGDLELLQTKGLPSTCPHTAIGFLYLGLRERKERGLPCFTVMSCDNLPENGFVAKRMVLEFAAMLDKDIAEWIETSIAFPATMVDRITPMTALEHKEILAKDFGVADRWPVVTEDFKQWVIEDNFPQGRPRWETVGAVICNDVKPFELMKLRLLNGGHSMVAYISYLVGYRFVDDAVNDVLISSFLRGYMDEVTSTIPSVSIELERYKEKIVERFGNRMIKDTLLRLCEDGSTKLYNTSKDALEELIEEDRHIHWATLGVAAWIVFLQSVPDEIVKDGNKEQLRELAADAMQAPRDLAKVELFLKQVYGEAVGSESTLIYHVSLSLFALKHCSVNKVLQCGGALYALLHTHIRTGEGLQALMDFTSTALQA